jgi:fumarate reductase subunit D
MLDHGKDAGQTSIHPLWAILLAVDGFLLGLGIMYFSAWSDPESKDFVQSSSGSLWIFLIAAQVAFWAVVAISLWSGLKTLHGAFRDLLSGSRLQSLLFAGIPVGLLSVAPRILRRIELVPLPPRAESMIRFSTIRGRSH